MPPTCSTLRLCLLNEEVLPLNDPSLEELLELCIHLVLPYNCACLNEEVLPLDDPALEELLELCLHLVLP